MTYQHPERSVEELCAPGHALHMERIKQDEWLSDLIALDEERKRLFHEELEADVAKFRETGKWPKRRAKKTEHRKDKP